MKPRGFIAQLSIRRQLLLAALLPMLLLTLALSGYMINSRMQDARQALVDGANTLLDYLVSASEFSLLTQNPAILEQLSRAPLKRGEVTDILYFNAQLKLLWSQQQHQLDIRRMASVSQIDEGRRRIELPGLQRTWALVQPVIMAGVAVDDFDQSRAPDRHLGWVVLLLNERQLQAKQQQIFWGGLLITSGGLLLAALLALWIGHNIRRPISRLQEVLTHYQQDNKPVQIEVTHTHELGALQQGVNDLIEQAQRHQEQLQSEVDRATFDLQQALSDLEQSNQKLQQSKESVERSGRAKDDFLARMSHELRTPISSVIGFIRLLEKSPLDDSQREYCRIILSASGLLLRLIDDILDFSKFQADTIQLEAIPFSPEQVLEDVLEMQAPMASSKNLRLQLECDADWPMQLLGDPTRFAQVITNLVSNAIKFTEQGQIRIRLHSQARKHVAELLIEIEDSGIGIPAEELPKLFQPFSQADSSTSRRFGGTGLGLVISKRLVELMGGELSLTSVVGKGSTFQLQLQLPLAESPALEALPKYRILVCCPDPFCRQRLQQQLEAWGCEVDSIDDRQQLLPQLAQQPQGYQRLLVSLTQEELKALSWNQFLNPVRQQFDGELILITEHCEDEFQSGMHRLLEQLAPANILHQPLGRYRLYQSLTGGLNADSHSEQTSNRVLQGLKVLLAEDNRFNRILISRMLQEQGADVTAVEDGEQALQHAQQQGFELIILDLHMPRLNGQQAAHQIRQLNNEPGHPPILILTADVVTNEASLLEPDQLQGVLYKPVDEALLVRQILKVVNPSKPLLSDNIIHRLDRFGIPHDELRRAMDDQFSELQQALLQDDSQRLREQIHQLSGLTAMAGLHQFDKPVQQLRDAAKQGNFSLAWQLYWEIKSSYDKSISNFEIS